MKFFINQTRNDDCGFACLKMLMAYTSKNEEFLYLPQNTERNRPYSLWDLLKLGNKFGFKLSCYNVSLKKETKKMLKLPILAVLHVGNVSHCVMVTKIGRRTCSIYDPARNVYKMKTKEFFNARDGNCLTVVEKKNIKYKSSDKKLVSNWTYFVNFLLQILSTGALLCGVFFTKNGEYIGTPLIFFSLFFILEILSKSYLCFLNKLIDSRMLEVIKENKTGNEYIENFESYNNYKVNKMTALFDLVSNVIVAITLSTLMILNNKLNAYYITSVFILFLFNFLIFDKIQKEKEDQIKEAEITFKNCRENNEIITQNAEILNEKSSKFMIFIVLRRYLVVFLLFILAFLNMTLSKNIAINYLFFNFGIYYVIHSSFTKISKFKDNKASYKLERAKITSLIYKNNAK